MSKTIQLIGVPTDIGAGARGASMGPEALRVAGIESMLRAHHLQVEDSGNLVGPANPWLPPTDGYRHLEQVRQWNQSLHEAYYEALKNGRLPKQYAGLADDLLTKHSFTTSEKVVIKTLNNLDAGKLYTIPQPDAKLFWLMKRASPVLYTKMLGIGYPLFNKFVK